MLFSLALSIFLLSPVSMVGDSKYSLLVAHSLLTRGTFAVDGYGIPRRPLLVDNDAQLDGDIYQIEVINGRLYGYFPPGTALLSTPFVLVANLFGQGVLGPDGAYNFAREEHLQRVLAACLMAALTGVFYATARLLLPAGWSALISLGAAFGTQLYSTASRALWAHTWGCLLLGIVLFLLLAREKGSWRLHPVWLATTLSWTYFVRPTNSLFIIGITGYLLVYHRRAFAAYAATGAAWFAGFVRYSSIRSGHLLPSYYAAKRLQTAQFWEALVGNVFSPSRGVVLYVPVALFVLFLVTKFWRQQPRRRLVWLALTVSGAHLLAVSCFVPWFGGGCYGPRYTTELVPWFVLLTVLGTRAALDWRVEPATHRGWAWTGILTVGGVLLLVSVIINARGACVPATEAWNRQPISVDAQPARVWDWRYPQMLAGWVDPPLPTVFPSLDMGRVVFNGNVGRDFLLSGWSPGEPDVCWSEGKRATLVFSTDHRDATALRVCFSAYVHGRMVRRQRIAVSLNGQRLGKFNIYDGAPHEYTFPVRFGDVQHRNLLAFDLPEATAPRSAGDGEDDRLLGIDLHWLELTSLPLSTSPSPPDTSAGR